MKKTKEDEAHVMQEAKEDQLNNTTANTNHYEQPRSVKASIAAELRNRELKSRLRIL